MAFLEGVDGLGASGTVRKYAQVIGPALLAVGAVVAAPKLIAYFKGQGIPPEEADLMAQEVIGGKRPMPQNFNPVPAKIMGLDAGIIKGFGIAAALGVSAFMFAEKRKK